MANYCRYFLGSSPLAAQSFFSRLGQYSELCIFFVPRDQLNVSSGAPQTPTLICHIPRCLQQYWIYKDQQHPRYLWNFI